MDYYYYFLVESRVGEEEVRTARSTVPRGVYIHRKVGEMEEME